MIYLNDLGLEPFWLNVYYYNITGKVNNAALKLSGVMVSKEAWTGTIAYNCQHSCAINNYLLLTTYVLSLLISKLAGVTWASEFSEPSNFLLDLCLGWYGILSYTPSNGTLNTSVVTLSSPETFLFSNKKYYTLKRLFEPVTCCVRDQDAITAPARQMWETGSLNWA